MSSRTLIHTNMSSRTLIHTNTQAGNRRYMIPCIVMVILFTNLVLGQATIRVLKFLKIPIGIVQDDDSDLVSPQV